MLNETDHNDCLDSLIHDDGDEFKNHWNAGETVEVHGNNALDASVECLEIDNNADFNHDALEPQDEYEVVDPAAWESETTLPGKSLDATCHVPCPIKTSRYRGNRSQDCVDEGFGGAVGEADWGGDDSTMVCDERGLSGLGRKSGVGIDASRHRSNWGMNDSAQCSTEIDDGDQGNGIKWSEECTDEHFHSDPRLLDDAHIKRGDDECFERNARSRDVWSSKMESLHIPENYRRRGFAVSQPNETERRWRREDHVPLRRSRSALRRRPRGTNGVSLEHRDNQQTSHFRRRVDEERRVVSMRRSRSALRRRCSDASAGWGLQHRSMHMSRDDGGGHEEDGVPLRRSRSVLRRRPRGTSGTSSEQRDKQEKRGILPTRRSRSALRRRGCESAGRGQQQWSIRCPGNAGYEEEGAHDLRRDTERIVPRHLGRGWSIPMSHTAGRRRSRSRSLRRSSPRPLLAAGQVHPPPPPPPPPLSSHDIEDNSIEGLWAEGETWHHRSSPHFKRSEQTQAASRPSSSRKVSPRFHRHVSHPSDGHEDDRNTKGRRTNSRDNEDAYTQRRSCGENHGGSGSGKYVDGIGSFPHHSSRHDCNRGRDGGDGYLSPDRVESEIRNASESAFNDGDTTFGQNGGCEYVGEYVGESHSIADCDQAMEDDHAGGQIDDIQRYSQHKFGSMHGSLSGYEDNCETDCGDWHKTDFGAGFCETYEKDANGRIAGESEQYSMSSSGNIEDFSKAVSPSWQNVADRAARLIAALPPTAKPAAILSTMPSCCSSSAFNADVAQAAQVGKAPPWCAQQPNGPSWHEI